MMPPSLKAEIRTAPSKMTNDKWPMKNDKCEVGRM